MSLIRTIKVALICSLSLFNFSSVSATEIKIQNIQINAPHINDYVLITQESDQKFYLLFETFTTQKNHLKVAYVQTDEYNQIKQGKRIGLKDYKMVQTIKAWEKFNISNKVFKKIKDKVRNDWTTILEKTKAEFPEVMAKISQDIKHKYKKDFSFEVKDILPVELLETERSITTINIGNVDSEAGRYKMAMANTIIQVKGKVVVLMSFRKFEEASDIQNLKTSTVQTRDAYLEFNQY